MINRQVFRFPGIRLLAVTALVLIASETVFALPTIKLTVGANPTITVADNSGFDLDPTAGTVIYSSNLGSYLVNVTTGITKPASGTAASPAIHLNVIALSQTASPTMTVEFSEDGYGPTSAPLKILSSSNTSGSWALTSYYGTNLFDEVNVLSTLSGSGALASTVYASVPLNPYSLTLKAVLTPPVGTLSSSFDFDISATPEPGFYGVLALGLSGLAALVLKRRKQEA